MDQARHRASVSILDMKKVNHNDMVYPLGNIMLYHEFTMFIVF